MHVRRATADDADLIVAGLALVADEGRWLGTEPGFDANRRSARVREQIAAGDGCFVLCEDDGRVVGCLALHETQAQGVMTLGMWILPDHRGRGGGRGLMDAALAHLEAGDAHKLELEVWPDNGRAIALYARYGFAVEGLRRDHPRRRDGSLRSSLILARPL